MLEAKVYKALGDPIRLEIVRRLSVDSSCTLGQLSKNLGITRQGARKQLQVLVDANVVYLEPRGREVDAALDIRTLQAARDFIFELECQWDKRLEALKSFAEKDL